MASKPDRKMQAEVLLEGVERVFPLIDTDEGKYATSAIDAFEHHRIIKTKIVLEDESIDVIANPDKVIAIAYKPVTEMVKYEDDVCKERLD